MRVVLAAPATIGTTLKSSRKRSLADCSEYDIGPSRKHPASTQVNFDVSTDSYRNVKELHETTTIDQSVSATRLLDLSATALLPLTGMTDRTVQSTKIQALDEMLVCRYSRCMVAFFPKALLRVFIRLYS
jgi:hypothetical protein